jgi:hypothetical protein
MHGRRASVLLAVGVVASVINVPVAGAVETDIAINTTVVDFGAVVVGTTGLPIAVTLTNTGGDPFGPINMFGGSPPTPEFSGSQNCQAQTLPAGGSCMVSYTFTPSAPLPFTDTSNFTISETSNQADGEAFTVSLTGLGKSLVDTPIAISTTMIDFGQVVVGQTATVAVTLTNTGGSAFGPINTFGGEPPTTEFTNSDNCQGETLAPGGSCMVTYTFTPSGPVHFTDMSSFKISNTSNQADGEDFAVRLTGLGVTTTGATGDTVGLVDPLTGEWRLRNHAGVVTGFFYGNPGDVPFMGDWDCDGIDTPGLFRQSDAFAYLRNSNSQGIADIRFFFGNPSDIPLAGDFDGNGCDSLSIYRPSEQRFYIINALGANNGGLGPAQFSFIFGDPGDKPFVGDFDGDGIDEVGLHRESTGFVYYRNTLDTGIASNQFFFGDPGDRFVTGDWGVVDGTDTPAMFRPSTTTFYFRHTNTQGVADRQFVFGQPPWLPVAGVFGIE